MRRTRLSWGWWLSLTLLAGCAPRGTTVHLTLSQLHDLETCVIAADDQVERQNCVERLYPKGTAP